MTKNVTKETTYTLTESELIMAILTYMERDSEAQKDIYEGETQVDFDIQTCAYYSSTGRPKVKIKGATVTIREEE